MDFTRDYGPRIVGLGLLVTVATLCITMALVQPDTEHAPPHAQILWRIELIAFFIIGLLGLAMTATRPLFGAGLAVGGIFNVIQLGIGITMFRPLVEAGESMDVVFHTVWAFAFYCFFAGKSAVGLSGLVLGGKVWGRASGGLRWLGLATMLLGLVAFFAGMAGMVAGPPMIFWSGLTGTISAFALGLLLLLKPTR